ncbi:uncharacterized protein AKAW2_80981A [Aspergillus luchuensis]|uniref:Uncharacterized protein n=1 Tax=Aspergillus kawachii TaxID=1069201 RepID=A0A7R7X9U9_ASPKA|nr:uncharacterized protein AKAW2_80981A [Aspergillus luchuensis]BCS05180.1 hypothetical protein AKAW2_80981A [Aspergillus luchuensis]BCS16739.1 hypothetical protein ALUC_80946A [Aspergillus luchuensis]
MYRQSARSKCSLSSAVTAAIGTICHRECVRNSLRRAHLQSPKSISSPLTRVNHVLAKNVSILKYAKIVLQDSVSIHQVPNLLPLPQGLNLRLRCSAAGVIIAWIGHVAKDGQP